jgi:hypothetical protein
VKKLIVVRAPATKATADEVAAERDRPVHHPYWDRTNGRPVKNRGANRDLT